MEKVGTGECITEKALKAINKVGSGVRHTYLISTSQGNVKGSATTAHQQQVSIHRTNAAQRSRPWCTGNFYMGRRRQRRPVKRGLYK